MSLRGHKGPVYSAKYSQDNKYIYSSGSDGEIKLWKSEDGEYVRPLIKNGWGISKFEIVTFLYPCEAKTSLSKIPPPQTRIDASFEGILLC